MELFVVPEGVAVPTDTPLRYKVKVLLFLTQAKWCHAWVKPFSVRSGPLTLKFPADVCKSALK